MRSTNQWLISIAGSTLLGLAPYLERALYTVRGIDLLGAVSPTWFFVVFAVLGTVAGALFSFRAAVGGPISCAVGLWLLTTLGFVGGGGDGDLFYLLAAMGSTAFSACALISGALRWAAVSRRHEA